MSIWNSRENIELYKFIEGEQVQRFTSSNKSVMRNGFTYEPKNISRDNIKSSTDLFQNSLKLTLPLTDSMAQTYIGTTVEDVVKVKVLSNVSGDFEYIWQGRLVSSSASGSMVELGCEEIITQTRRMGAVPAYQHSCRHVLYSDNFGINKEDFALTAQIESISGLTVTLENSADLSSKGDGYYSAGILEFKGAKRFIESQVGNVIKLTRCLNSEQIGEATIYAGYSHSIEDCIEKFGNLLNYGGFLYIDDDPFTLGNIFNKG